MYLCFQGFMFQTFSNVFPAFPLFLSNIHYKHKSSKSEFWCYFQVFPPQFDSEGNFICVWNPITALTSASFDFKRNDSLLKLELVSYHLSALNVALMVVTCSLYWHVTIMWLVWRTSKNKRRHYTMSNQCNIWMYLVLTASGQHTSYFFMQICTRWRFRETISLRLRMVLLHCLVSHTHFVLERQLIMLHGPEGNC